MKALRNAWYVASHSSELADQPLGRDILGMPMVLYRTSRRQPVAMYNRCPHRLLPLSMGHVLGDNLQCGYHGATFDASGLCVSVPGDAGAAAECNVRTFPAIEKHGFIWVWPGTPGLRDDGSSIPDFLEVISAPTADVRDGSYISLQANYLLVVDNLLDATHAQYVHPTTLGAEGLLGQREAGAGKFHFEIAGNKIKFTFHLDSGRAGPCFHQGLAKKLGLPRYDAPVDWHLDVWWQAPSFHLFYGQTKPAGAPDSEFMSFYTVHAITPETETSSHYFFKSVEHVKDSETSFNDFWAEATFHAFSEDKAVLEAQQKALGDRRIHESANWGRFSSDRLGMEARTILGSLIEQETGRASGGQPAELTKGCPPGSADTTRTVGGRH